MYCVDKAQSKLRKCNADNLKLVKINSTIKSTKSKTCYANLRHLQRFGNIDSNLNVCLWNAQSLSNKTIRLVEYVLDHDIDIMILTETWLRDDDNSRIMTYKPFKKSCWPAGGPGPKVNYSAIALQFGGQIRDPGGK